MIIPIKWKDQSNTMNMVCDLVLAICLQLLFGETMSIVNVILL